ncbi:MAG: histidine ammonia-lyase [Planctomycetota bacterium]
MTDAPLVLDGSPLRIEHVDAVARRAIPVRLAESQRPLLDRARAALDRVASDGEPHYGVNTGFGSLSRTRVGTDELVQLQLNLVRSHAAGIGEPLPDETVRAMLVILAASLSRGASGVRPIVVETILGLLNAGVTPIVPSIGSVGASGDLAPLAHASLVLLGEGRARVGDTQLPGAEALAAAGLKPLSLAPKEGLALINGTHLMAAEASLLLVDTAHVLAAGLVAGGLAIDACKATDAFLDTRVASLRAHPGVGHAASILRDLLAGSEIVDSHKLNDSRVQDPYSLRCQPQVLGAVIESCRAIARSVRLELGAVTDNPLLFEGEGTGTLVSAGNFHGMPIALPLDHLAIALSHIAGMSERRVFYMLAGTDTEAALRPYLATRPGLTSGLMIVQYTAAACCNELIGLASPASVANLSTSAGVEDYNSFGPRSAAKARRAVELTASVVASELMCAAEAIDHHRPLRTGHVLERAHAMVRERVDRLEDDRSPSGDLETLRDAIVAGEFGALVDLVLWSDGAA